LKCNSGIHPVVEDLELAKARVRELSRDSNTEYAIFNQHTKEIVFDAMRESIAERQP
jgi:hypothetical protein